MRLENIRFGGLKRVTMPNAWGQGDVRAERFVYRDDRYFFKIWGPLYHARLLVRRADRWVLHEWRDPDAGLIGFDIGFFDPEICAAFVDLIRDHKGRCRGYVLRVGEPVDQLSHEFIERVWAKSEATGYCHQDLYRRNTCRIGDQISLIDLDTTFVAIEALDVEVERETGALREHVDPRYQDKILSRVRGAQRARA